MPDRIGRYEAERVLGSGAFATVWLARDDRLDAQVAVKVLAENWAHDEDVRRRFTEEARILWRLDSDRIIRVHGVDELEDGRPYFVMDYADLGSLADRMAARVGEARPYAVEEALDIAIDIADALAIVHGLGVVHRDLKPSNVMYRSVASHHRDSRPERMVLADFGIARLLDGGKTMTIAAGTPHYMAPEQSEGLADERCDIYAAAVLLYELLASRVPFPFESMGAVLRAQLTETPPLISTVRADTPAALDAALARGLESDPAKRFASADEWAAALREVRAALATAPDEPERKTTDRSMAETYIPAAPPPMPAAPPEVGAAAAAAAGPPAGSPPRPPTPSPSPSRPTGGGRRRGKRKVVGMLLVVALMGGVVGIASVMSGEEAAAGEIFLEPRDSTRAGNQPPFTPPVVDPKAVIPTALASHPNAVPVPAAVGGAIPTVVGTEPGLYGGTRSISACDPTQMVSFLQQNADKAKAWADAMGIGVPEIPSFVAGLTSVVLRSDTRVTNHGFSDGLANPIQSVLQAGTAVLVDHFGVPRVKCFCGNPLKQPKPVERAPEYQGSKWPEFEPGAVTVITPAPQPVTVIVVVDVNSGQPFARPVGTDGRADANAVLPPRPTATSRATTTTKATSTTKGQTTTTKASAGGNEAAAIKLVRDALQACIEALRREAGSGATVTGNADSLDYEAHAEGNGVFQVIVSERSGPDRGTWRVDTKTKDLTPIDQTAMEVGQFCPGMA